MSAVTIAGLMLANAAHADTIFVGSGLSGFLNPPAGEPWAVTGPDAAPDGLFGWGSPGVNLGLTEYTGDTPAFGFEITFENAEIDLAQIAIGSASSCEGTQIGGTVFCGSSFVMPWTVELLSPSSIRFFEPLGGVLETGTSYFVNIFLVGDEARDLSFSGAWLTAATPVPEPGTLLLLGIGMAGAGLSKVRRRGGRQPAVRAGVRTSDMGAGGHY